MLHRFPIHRRSCGFLPEAMNLEARHDRWSSTHRTSKPNRQLYPSVDLARRGEILRNNIDIVDPLIQAFPRLGAV